MLRTAIVLLAATFLFSSAAIAEKRVALVIGNGAYAKVARLDNPKNDAAAVEAMFKAASFDTVVRVNDLGVAAMRRALRDFSDTAYDADVAVVFYAGHGVEVGGVNYLIPTDAVLERDIDVQDEAIPLERVNQILERVKHLRLIILDACRDNPFVRSMRRTLATRAVRSGYGEIDERSLPPNTLVAYAQRAGAFAEDGTGANSPYTTALLKHLPTPGLDVELALRRVRDDVLKTTKNRQEPFKYGSLGGTEIALVAAQSQPKSAAISLDGLMVACVKELIHPNSAAIVGRLAQVLQQGRFEYAWEDTGAASKLVVAHDIRSAASVKDELHIAYDWQNGSLHLKAVAPMARATRSARPVGEIGPPGAPGTDFQGVWLQDNSFGCVQVRLTSEGEGTGAWGIRTGDPDAKVFVRLKKQQVAIAPTPQATVKCDGIEALVGRERRCLKLKESFKDCDTCPEMVMVPAGSFTMGSPANEPQREDNETLLRATISRPFAVGRHAVTRREFATFVQDGAYKISGGCYVAVNWDGNAWKQQANNSWRSPGFEQNDRHPVVCVNWNDAKAFAAWLSKTTGKSYRLLSEVEREYVTRAGTTTPFWWGSSISPKEANYQGSLEPYKGGGSKGEFLKATVAVDKFEANPWGLYQVHGNVYEWTEDCWNDSNTGNSGNGGARTTGDCSRRVLRGGSWINYPQYLRAAFRGRRHGADERAYNYGFRVARTSEP